MGALATLEDKKYMLDFTDEEKKIIRNQFFPPSASAADMQYCINVAKEVGLNPILKEIYFVERKAKVNGQWVTKIEPMPGRNAWYKLAHNSGKFGGIESEAHIEDVPVLRNGKWTVEPDLVATATVYRTDSERPFRVKVAFHEYAQRTREGKLTQFWETKPETMLIKVAEVQALKKAFTISGIYDEAELDGEITIPTQEQQGVSDLNAILSKKPEPESTTKAEPVQAQVETVEEAQVVEPEPETEQPRQEQSAEPVAPKRMPLRVSKRYPLLLDAGLKQKELKEFCVEVGLPNMSEEEVAQWFATENLSAWADWYHGIGYHPHSLEYREQQTAPVMQPKAQVVTPEPEPVAATEPPKTEQAEQPHQPEPEPEPQIKRQPGAAISEVSNSVVSIYPKLIKMGLRGPDCMHFVKWAGITNDNVDEFMADLGGVQGLIEQFYEEAGDVTPRDR